MAVTTPTASHPRTGYGTLRQLNGYQWFVFVVAVVAWMADCMDQQFFNLARQTSITDLLGGSSADPDDVKRWAGRATSVFLIGWATGGLVFGMFGDRIGRVRTLTYTILLYSVFTGLSAISTGVYDYCGYRFLTGLGVGGVFAAAVALLAETMPPDARPYTLGLMQAFSAVGNCTAAGLFILLGLLSLNGQLGGYSAWRLLFLIGLLPAILVIFIQRKLHEPESWLAAKKAADAGTGRKLGSYADLFGGGWVTRHAILGVILSFVGVVGLWGIGFFAVDLQQNIFNASYKAEAEAQGLTGDVAIRYVSGQKIIWAGYTSLSINIGAFFGMTGFSLMAGRLGRRPAFAITFLAAAGSVALVFTQMRDRMDVIWMNALMGFCLLALFGGYAIYLPELFPTRLRATGTSFCYNVGRFIAASGPLLLGFLTTNVFASAKSEGPDMPFRYAGLAMCSIFALGLVVLPFLPETKGKPLPE